MARPCQRRISPWFQYESSNSISPAVNLPPLFFLFILVSQIYTTSQTTWDILSQITILMLILLVSPSFSSTSFDTYERIPKVPKKAKIMHNVCVLQCVATECLTPFKQPPSFDSCSSSSSRRCLKKNWIFYRLHICVCMIT